MVWQFFYILVAIQRNVIERIEIIGIKNVQKWCNIVFILKFAR